MIAGAYQHVSWPGHVMHAVVADCFNGCSKGSRNVLAIHKYTQCVHYE